MFSAVLTFLLWMVGCILPQRPISQVQPRPDWPIKIFSGHAQMLMTLDLRSQAQVMREIADRWYWLCADWTETLTLERGELGSIMVLRDSNRWRTMEPDNLRRAELSGHLASARSPGMLSVSPGANLNPIDFTDGQLAWTQVTTATTGPGPLGLTWGRWGQLVGFIWF